MKRLFTMLAVWMFVLPLFSQKTINGSIMDANGNEVIGASVAVKKDGQLLRGTSTDLSGDFKIAMSSEDSLFVYYLGYKDQGLSFEDLEFDNLIVIEQETYNINTIVVVAYGSMFVKCYHRTCGQVREEHTSVVEPESVKEKKTDWLTYPNPTFSTVQVELKSDDIGGTIEIRSSIGMLIRQVQVSHFPVQLNLSDLPAGAYFLWFRQNEKIELIDKVIKVTY